MLPVIALVGRPNVGKSTLFNRITRSRNALVANLPGLTRDRQYAEASFEGHRFIVVDTGGLGENDAGIDAAMAGQSLTAIEEADCVLFLVDCRAGLSSGDIAIARYLREHHKKTLLIVNKSDGLDPDVATSDFFALGFSDVLPIAAVQGRGVNQLLKTVVRQLYPEAAAEAIETEEDDWAETERTAQPLTQDTAAENSDVPTATQPANLAAQRAIKIAVVGRPNVGKSTLVNRMLGEERVVVFDLPGTTRDSIYIDYERNGELYTLIDTAGIRKRRHITEAIEKFSIVKTLQAIEDAHVVILMMDASEGIVEQDLHLLGHVIDKGRALVVAINKWDGLDEDQRNTVKRALERRLHFIDFAAVHFISALHGSGVGNLYGSVHKAFTSATKKLSTPFLTRILEDAVATNPPPLVNGRRIKLRYAHAGGQNPPIIIIHGNQGDKAPDNYTRYLEKTFRKALEMAGTPLRIEYRSSDNPYQDKRNTLTPSQMEKRKRFLRHVKKSKR